jgi:hypothetical protein
MTNEPHVVLKRLLIFGICIFPAWTLARFDAAKNSGDTIALSNLPRAFDHLTKKRKEHGCNQAIPAHCFINLQGYDCAFSLALKRRAACTFIKFFLNLIKNFTMFIQLTKSVCISEMISN